MLNINVIFARIFYQSVLLSCVRTRPRVHGRARLHYRASHLFSRVSWRRTDVLLLASAPCKHSSHLPTSATLRLSPSPVAVILLVGRGGRGPLSVHNFQPLRIVFFFFFSFLLSVSARIQSLCSAHKTSGWSPLPSHAERGLPRVLVMRLLEHSPHSVRGIPVHLKKPPQ